MPKPPPNAKMARKFGAEGIGLCRTEHMFFDAGRISAVREMILADSEAGRRAALDKLLPEQRSDFVTIFEVMAGLPCTIRLLDPPLHEFLPHTDDTELEESWPRQRACRPKTEAAPRPACTNSTPCSATAAAGSAITYPEIYEMQARAIFEAALLPGEQTGAPSCRR